LDFPGLEFILAPVCFGFRYSNFGFTLAGFVSVRGAAFELRIADFAFRMKIALYHHKDFWAGIMLIVFGAASIFIARDYSFGSTMRMGPGYFPSVLGGLLVLFGVYVMLTGLRAGETITVNCSIRALIVLSLSLVAFGVLMTHAGFIPAMAVLIFGSASAGREFKFVEVLLLTVILTGLSVAIFIWGLGLPYQLIKGL
jgi:hypothetical protein